MKISFQEVRSQGQTTTTAGDCDVDAPTGFTLFPTSPARCYEITTTAEHTDLVELCISYGTDSGPNEEMLLAPPGGFA